MKAKPLDVIVEGNAVWIAQSDAVVLKLDIEVSWAPIFPSESQAVRFAESGNILQAYKGHTAPVTTIALLDHPSGNLLVSGFSDKVRCRSRYSVGFRWLTLYLKFIKIWDTRVRSILVLATQISFVF